MSDWELSKENVQPLKSGRRLTSFQSDPSVLRKEKQEYETALRTYTGDDPLEVWHSYILWIEQAYPKGGKSGHLVELCERCISQFTGDERYKNDQRYIEVWIKYSNCVNDPQEIFQFMYDKMIGTQLVLFYEAWATCAEIAGLHKKANAIYESGIENGAQPFELLKRRHEEFQKRIVRGAMAQEQEDDQEMDTQDSREALGQLRTVGRKHTVPNIRIGAMKQTTQGGLGLRPAAPNQVTSGIKIYNDENAAPSVLPAQTGEWGEVPHRKVVNKENELKAGPWTKGKKFPTKSTPGSGPVHSSRPSFTVHEENPEDQQMKTPMKMPEVGKQVLSSRKPEKPADPLMHIRMQDDLDPTQKPVYCKSKIYCGADEFSFEEIRAARWRAKRKKEEEKKRMDDERREIEASREELRRNQEILKQQAEELRQQSMALKKEQEAMVEKCRQQLFMQQEQFNTERQLQIQRQKELLDNDIQRRMQQTDINSGNILNRSSLSSNENSLMRGGLTNQQGNQRMEEGLSNQSLNNSRRTPTDFTNTRQHLKPEANPDIEMETQTNHGLNMSNRTPSEFRLNNSYSSGKLSAPTPDSLKRSLTAPSPTVNTKEAMQLVLGMFNASLEIDKYEDLGREKGSVTGNQSGDQLKQITNTAPGSSFMVYDESQPQQSAKSITKPAFTVFDENEVPMSKPETVNKPQFMVYDENRAEPKAQKKPFTVFDENAGCEGKKTAKTDGFTIFEDSAPKTSFQETVKDHSQNPPAAPRRKCLGGVFHKEEDVVKIPFTLLHDEEERMEGIESQARDDFTIAPVGSHLSFAAAARCASTPFQQEMNSLQSIPDISQINTDKTRGENFSVQNNTDVKDLSPIMEGSNEESDGHATNSTTGSVAGHEPSYKHPSKSLHSHIQSIPEQSPPPSKTGCAIYPDDDQGDEGQRKSDLDALNQSEHVIDTTTYIPPDLDEKTEALLSTSIYIDPHDPFDAETIQGFLNKLTRPLSLYENYVKEDGKMVRIQPAENTTLGGDFYTVIDEVGRGGNARVYKAEKIDFNTDFTVGGIFDENFKAIKVQRPPCPWELYICNEIQERLARRHKPNDVDVRPAMMSVEKGCFFDDASCLITKYYSSGTLLDLVNKLKVQNLATEENLACYLTIEMLHMVEKLHRCQIIHGDIKPDNFMLLSLPDLPECSDPGRLFTMSPRPLALIDFGQSIDMTKYPLDTTFMAKVKTDGFQCIEMKTDRPWTYQTDLFGLVGTVHVLVFKKYMNVYQENGVWKIVQSFPRKWNKCLWKKLFNECLNVPSCSELPDLAAIRREFEEYFVSLRPHYNSFIRKVKLYLK